MNIVKACYYYAADQLKELLPYIPEVKLTEAKTYDGKIHRQNGVYTKIYLSKWNLDGGSLTDQEDINEIFDTVCHEFAHMYFWDHSKEHEELTETFYQIVIAKLQIEKLNEKLNTQGAA